MSLFRLRILLGVCMCVYIVVYFIISGHLQKKDWSQEGMISGAYLHERHQDNLFMLAHHSLIESSTLFRLFNRSLLLSSAGSFSSGVSMFLQLKYTMV